MTARDVLILVEHVDRELDAVSCIAHLLHREHGLGAEIRNFYADMPFALKRYYPRVVVTPFFYFLNHHPMKDYVAAWPNTKFVNLAWEQINYKLNRAIKIPQDNFAKQNVKHVCWTTGYRDFLCNLGAPPENVILSGNPVMKFYDFPYCNYFANRASLARDYGLDPARKWVLFPENYRWGFLNDKQVQAFVAQGADPVFIEQARDYCRRSLAKLISCFQAFDRSDAPQIILRPRPATAIAEMTALISNAGLELPKNVALIKGHSAREWILAADHVISSYSTTLIEAALAGKPIHVFSPEPFPEALEDAWYGYIDVLPDCQSLLSACSGPNMENWRGLANWAREALLPNGDPLRTIANAIAKAFGEVAPPGWKSVTPDHSRLWGGRVFIEKGRKLLQRRPAFHKWLKTQDHRYAFTVNKHEKDIFGADDVAARISRWSGHVRLEHV